MKTRASSTAQKRKSSDAIIDDNVVSVDNVNKKIKSATG